MGRVPLALAAVLAAVGVLYLLWPDWHWVHHEGGPLEISQLSVVLASVITVAAIIARQHGKDRINAVWLLTLFLLLAARELDLQEQLNEEVLGEWAVSYRSRWWMSWDVPLGIKLMWGGVGALLGTALVIPPLLVRAPVLKLLRAGDAGTWLFFGGCFFYGMGYVMDDILGRGVLVDGDQGQVIEEICELIGGLGFLTSTMATLRTPLTRRIAALPRRTGA
jgi:hypothetical protein